MRYSRVQIDSVGYELAPVVVSSEELEEALGERYRQMGFAPGMLEELTGIEERRFWDPGESLSAAASRAAAWAIEKSGVPSEKIETLIYAGVCRENFEPATACAVAAALAGRGLALSAAAAIFDLGNACLGVLNGMVEIANRIQLGQIRAGIVVSAESAREIVETTVRRLRSQAKVDSEQFRLSLATFTGGSGAAAVVLSDGSFSAADGARRLLGGVSRSRPVHHMLCRWGLEPGPSAIAEDAELPEPTLRPFMRTDAVGVLEHGVELAGETHDAFREELGADAELDRTISHQVGRRHREAVLRRIGRDPAADFVSYRALGNTGSVAVPMAYALAEERGFLQPEHRVGLFGIGSGLNCMMLALAP